MKRDLLILLFIICPFVITAQTTLFTENFGNTGFYRGPANLYTGFSSGQNFFSADSAGFHNWETSVSDYTDASAQSFAMVGKHDGNDISILQLQGINTEGYENIKLRFGAATYFGIASDYLEISYSTDGTDWVTMDDASLFMGSYANAAWARVTLSKNLPASSSLYIRFHVSDEIQTVRLDDVEIFGYLPDNTPPTAPIATETGTPGSTSFTYSWSGATDDVGIAYYIIYQDGVKIATTPDTIYTLNYLSPGLSAEYSVATVDLAGNVSNPTTPLTIDLPDLPADFAYSWQEPHATVIETGDLEWMPLSFVFKPGEAIRYIDFEAGDDNNDGISKATAWKHHPWDANATGNAAGETGVHTYVFKRGVVYRGVLQAKESGSPDNPIKLTSDPEWGSGEAMIYGSVQLSSGWIQADATTAPNIPEPEKVWYQDILLPETKNIVEIDGNELKPVRVARTPNYQYTPDDPLRTWPTMNRKVEAGGSLWLTDDSFLTQDNPDYYNGGTIWSKEDAIVMCTFWWQDIQEWDPENNRVKVGNENFGGVGSHYYIENTPFLLDTTSEFYYDTDINRLYVRLDGEKNPNTTALEVAIENQLIEINNKNHIEISGLHFGYTTENKVRFSYGDCVSTIRMTGYCNGINIKNNSFTYVNGGVSLNSTANNEVTSGNINISDNKFEAVYDLGIVFNSGGGNYMEDISIMRNHMYDVGSRHLGRWYSSIPAIWGQFKYAEIAGNIIHTSWGNGLNFFWGKGGSDNDHVPFIRGLVHHNKAHKTLIGTNDYGGIEGWQGGPTYYYNNISHDAAGYKHYNSSSIGYNFYFDGSFKHYVFNNIASGVSHERAAASYMQVLGFYNMYVHNTGYNTPTLFNGASNALELNGHNAYLSNVGVNVKNFFRHQMDTAYIPFESYGYNIASVRKFSGSIESKSNSLDLEAFRSKLESYNSQLTHTGWNSLFNVLLEPENFNFKPGITSEALDRGISFFTAFPLSAVVGEWHFYKHPADSTVIMADNFYMTSEYASRTEYKNIPKNHLKAESLSDTSFVVGPLEDWTSGALRFNGTSTFCSLPHASAKNVKANNVDMHLDNFILEAYFRTEKNHTGGALIAKHDNASGYQLSVDDAGMIKIALFQGGVEAVSRVSSITVNDSAWHHVLVEVRRNGSITIYLDGNLSNGDLNGLMPDPLASLSNSEDLLIGKNIDGNFFAGTVDFLRISKGTLQDARTTYHELYTWMTDGPFKYDFTGKEPVGERDAGAIEGGEKLCDLSVEKTALQFTPSGGEQSIAVSATTTGYSILDHIDEFYSINSTSESLTISVPENTTPVEHMETFIVHGCNAYEEISVFQEAAPCEFEVETDTLFAAQQKQTIRFHVNTNGEYDAIRNLTFFQLELNAAKDSVIVFLTENTSISSRRGEITLRGCAEESVIILQEGVTTSTGFDQANNFIVYPNPLSNGMFMVKQPENFNETELFILDLTGKTVYTEKLINEVTEINTGLQAGMYVLEFRVGDELYQQQLVIQ